MTAKHRNLRAKMLFTTAAAALFALPNAAQAQLVSNGDLVTAEDSAGNPGQITVTNPDASTANISVLAPVVIANWTQFNVPVNTTLNVSNASAAAQASLLNRVVGGGFSDIGGTINATDVNLWLLNQNGIIFGSNTSVNAASFFASTLGITDADFFDFYEGTNNAGNGSQTLNFSSPATSFMIAPAGASFVTDGSLFFAGPGLSLNASFDAGSGTVSFVAANNFDVTFSAGSPLSYTITAGTIIADQLVEGTVAGESADFVFQTAAGVMSAMLTVNADVATTAAATERGIYLYAGGASPASVTVGGALSSTGGVEADVTGNLTISQDLSGSYATLQAAGNVSTQGVTATSGAIDVDSTMGGNLSLGDLDAGSTIALDTAGSVQAGAIRTDGGLFVGSTPSSVTFTGNAVADQISIASAGPISTQALTSNQSLSVQTTGGDLTTGNVTVSSPGAGLSLRAGGATSDLATQDLRTNGGDILVSAGRDLSTATIATALTGVPANGTVGLHAGGAIDTQSVNAGEDLVASAGTTFTGGALTAGDDIDISAAGTITVASAAATGTGIDTFSVGFAGAPGASGLVFALETPALAGSNVRLTSTAGNIAGGTLDADSDVILQANAGDVTTSGLSRAGGDMSVDAAGAVSLAGTDVVGAVRIGQAITPASVAFTANATAGAFDIDTTGALDALAITATAGDIDIDAGSVSAGAVRAADDIFIDAPGAIVLASARADNDASGAGNLTIGATTLPTSLTITGTAQGVAVDLQAAGNLQLVNVTSTGGVVDLDSTGGAITAAAVSATGGNALLTAPGAITATAITSTAGIDVDSTMGGNLSLGRLIAGSAIAIDTSGAVMAGATNAVGALTVGTPMAKVASAEFTGNVSAASVNVQTAGMLTAQDLQAIAGSVTLMADAIDAKVVRTFTGDAVLMATNGITTTSIAASTGMIDVNSTMGGNLSLGTLNAGSTIALDTAGSVLTGAINAVGALTVGAPMAKVASAEFTGNVSAASVNVQTAGMLTAQNLQAIAGSVTLMADAIDAKVVRTFTGDAVLMATNGITTTSIAASTGMIDVDSTMGGNLSLGALDAGSMIALDTAGSVGISSAKAGGAFTIGGAVNPASVTATGVIAAASIDFDVIGALSALGITATAGDIDIDAGSVSAGALRATDDVFVDAAGSVSLASARADSDASGSGNLAIGATTLPSSLTVTGASQGVAVDLQAAGNLQLGNVTATEAIDVDSTGGGALSLGALNAGTTIALDTSGTIQAGTVTAGGALTIGNSVQPTSVVLTGNASGSSVDIRSVNGLTARDVTAATGAVFLLGETILAEDVQAAQNLLFATQSNTGTATFDSLTSFNGLVAVNGAVPGTITVNGSTSGNAVNLVAIDELALGKVTSTSGGITLNTQFSAPGTGQITTGSVSATGGNARLISSGGVSTTSITSTEAIDVDSTGGGALSLGALNAGTTIALDTTGSVTAGSATANGAFTVGASAVPASATFTGAITAASIDFDVIGALSALNVTATAGDIDIDAGSVSAGALAATDDVFVDAAGSVSLASARADSDASGAGNLAIGATTLPSSLTVTGASQGVAVDLQAAGNLQLGNVISTGGVVDLDSTGGSITATAVSATGGNALLTAPGAITTTAITSTAGIDVDSTMGGDLSLGTLNAGSTIALDTAGSARFGSATAGGTFTIGAAVDPSSVTATGAITAASIDFDVIGALSALNVTATAGDIDIDAGSVSAGALAATDDVFVDAAGSVSLASARADSDASGAGNLAIGATTLPSSLTVTGASQGVAVDLQAAGNLQLGNVISTGGVVDLDSTGGSITATVVSATGGDALLTAPGAITTTAITSTAGIDVDSTMGGNLSLGTLNAGSTIALDTAGSARFGSATAGGTFTIGAAVDPSSVTATGAITAASIDFDVIGALSALNVTATAGDIDIDAGSVSAGALAATDDVFVDAAGSVSLASARADSDASGAGNLAIGATTLPSSLTVTGASQGVAVDLQAAGNLQLGNVISTGGVVDLDSTGGSITAAAVSATGGNALLTAPGAITTTAITSTAGIDVDSTMGGDLSLGTLNAGSTIALDTAGSARFGSATAGGTFTIGAAVDPSSVTATGAITAASIDFDVIGALSALNVTATAGDIDIDAGSVSAGALAATDDVFVDAAGSVSLASARADSDASGAGNLAIGATTLPSSLTVTGASQGVAVDLQAAGNLQLGNVISTGGVVDLDSTGGSITATAVTATGGNALLTAAQNVSTGGGVTSTGDVDIDAINGAISTGPVTAVGKTELTAGTAVSSTGPISGRLVDIDAGGNVSLRTVASTGGVIDIDSANGSITATGITANGGDALLTAAQNVTASGAVTSTGKIDIDANNGSISTVAVTAAGNAEMTARTSIASTGPISGRLVDVDAGGNVSLTTVASTAGKVDIDSTGGSITTTGVTATGGNAELTARNAITTTGTVRATAGIDIDSTGGGTLALGQALTTSAIPALTASGAIALDTTGGLVAGATTAGGALTVGSTASPSSATFTGPVSAQSATVRTLGTFTSQATVNAGAAATVTARDVAIGAGFTATNVTLRAGASGPVALGSGSATFSLSDAELDRVAATTLTIDAGANAVTVTDVSLTGAAGSSRVNVATTGAITFAGDLTADGANRIIRLGGNAASGDASVTGLASRISGNIDAVTINVGQATLDLRGGDIAFGRTGFLTDVAGRGSQELAILFVGNAASSLYNSTLLGPLSGDRAGDPVYLRAGSLSVSYGNSALFQNTGLATSGATTNAGVVIGSTSGGGTLNLDTIDPTNAFALFGEINNLVGPSAAVAGPSVIIVDGTVQPPFSRINGCLIASGAGCLNTIVGAVQLSLPRESVNPLSAETGLLVPFDPLVGTNNEGLFSDAAPDGGDFECPRDENGVCVDRQGGN